MDKRFVGDEILLTIQDEQNRDLSTGYSLVQIIVVLSATNTVVETLTATAGGTGNASIIASAETAAATFAVPGQYTYHAKLTTTVGSKIHRIGLGYVDILAEPGV